MFKNAQWEVNKYGIRAIPGSPAKVGITTEYSFEAARLTEITNRTSGIFYDWPVHLAEKNWVIIDLFIEAYTAALKIHEGKYSTPVDVRMLGATILEAQRIARECDEEEEKIRREQHPTQSFRFANRADFDK